MKKILVVLFLLFSFIEVHAEETRVAVLPFRNLMQKEDLNWLSEGIASTITAKLGNVKGLALVERTQLQLTLKELGLQMSGVVDDSTAVKAGKSMGAQIVVLGEFQVVGDQVRISARFVEVQTAKVVSTTVVTGSFQNIFTLQDDVSFSLAKSLNIEVPEELKKEIKSSSPSSLTAYEYYSKGYDYAWNQKDTDKAIEHYQKAISIDPNYENALFGLGYIYNERKEYRKAIEYYNKLAALYPKKDVFNNLGLAYSGLEDIPNAEKWYRKSLELDPSYTPPLNGLGLIMYKGKRYREAENLYKRAIQSDPKYYLAYYNLGILYSDLQRDDESIEYCKKAIDINPGYANAMINLGLLYETKKKNYAEAENWYKKAIETEPNNHLSYYNMGFLFSNKEYEKYDVDKAISYYQQAIIAKSDYDLAYFYMANLYVNKKEYQKAVNAYEKAIQIYDKDPSYYNDLGLAYELQKNNVIAEKYYRKAIDVDPKYGTAWESLGYALYYQMKDSEAIEAWKKAVSLGRSGAKEALKKYFNID